MLVTFSAVSSFANTVFPFVTIAFVVLWLVGFVLMAWGLGRRGEYIAAVCLFIIGCAPLWVLAVYLPGKLETIPM